MSSRPRLLSVLAALAAVLLVASGCAGETQVVLDSPDIEPSADAAGPGGDAGGAGDPPAVDGAEPAEEDAGGGFKLPPLGEGTGDEITDPAGTEESGESGTVEPGFLKKAAEATDAATAYRYEMAIEMQISDGAMSIDVSPDEPFAVGAMSGTSAHTLLDMGPFFDAVIESLDPSQAGAMQRLIGDDLSMEIITVDGARMYVRAPMLGQLAGEGQLPGGADLAALRDGWAMVDLGQVGYLSAEDLAQLTGTQGSTTPDAIVGLLREASADVTEVGRVDVRGVATTHLRARVNMGAMMEAQGLDRDQLAGVAGDLDAMLDVELPFEVYVDDEDRVRRVSLTLDPEALQDLVGESAPPGADFSFTSTIDMFDFGADIEITPPPADQIVADLTDAFLALGGS